jgi:hypothetical protein
VAARNRSWQHLPVETRRRLLRQRFDAVCNAALVIVGLQLLLLGCAMELNIVSLRELTRGQRLGQVVALIFVLRNRLSHQHAQAAELLLGLLGAAAIAAGATRELLTWYRLARRR